MDYACDPSVAGNLFQLRAGTHLLTGKVKSTDSWDGYQKIKIGTILLDAGRHRVTFRSEGRIHGYLIDLRGLELVPDAEKP